MRPSVRSGKSGRVSELQSAFRAHLARIEETSSGFRFSETGQYGTAEPIFASALQLGQKTRLSRNKENFIGAASKSAWVGVSKRRGWKDHPRSSAAGLGKLSTEGA